MIGPLLDPSNLVRSRYKPMRRCETQGAGALHLVRRFPVAHNPSLSQSSDADGIFVALWCPDAKWFPRRLTVDLDRRPS